MQETIIITGYNGELAKETHKLLKNNYNIISLTTNKKYVDNNSIFYWNPEKNTISKNALKNCNHIIHLAGYSILKRWTKKNKELKLKYELEKNVSLVSFKDKKIEISFNENLDKNFVKELSLKLFEWTGQRWIIAFSNKIGQLPKKQKESLPW